MKVLVTYLSKTGNTRKVAEAIFEGIGDEKEIKPIEKVDSLEGYDVSFLGFPIHQMGPDKQTVKLLETHCIDRRKVVLFITHAAPEDNPDLPPMLAKFWEAARGAAIVDRFDCQGELNKTTKRIMSFLPNAKLRSWAKMDNSQGQPDQPRLDRARAFSQAVMKRLHETDWMPKAAEERMKIEYFHASHYGNGARVAAEFKRQMEVRGVKVNVRHVRDAKPQNIAPADLYLFSSPGRFGKPIGDMQRFLKAANLAAGAKYAVLTTEPAPRPDREGRMPTEEETGKCQHVIPIMNETLQQKGLVSLGQGKIYVTGLKGPLEEGWQKKVEAFTSQIYNRLEIAEPKAPCSIDPRSTRAPLGEVTLVK